MTRQTLARSAAGLAAVVAVAGGYAYLQKDMISRAVAAPVATATATTAPASGVAPVAVAAPMDFSGIVDRYGPAVVNISTTAHAQRTSMQGLPPGMSPDDPFSEFFKRFMPQMPQQRGDQIVRGLGSGFIVSADGLILTNAHVVDGAQEVNVKLTDRREFKAKVLGVDKQSDVAVLRISAKNLPVVQIGSPANTKVGEPVLAIGSPYGFENTVTAGIVSAKSRSLPDDTYVPFIQTDVAVNPGNSGGPLFNQRGEVIGINSQIYSQSGGYMGISFAIPIAEAMRVADELRAGGRVVRGFLGVLPDDITKEVAEAIGLGKAAGAVVRNVTAGSPAEKGGVEGGDVITKVDGKPVEKAADLRRLIAAVKPGAKATLTVFRRGAYKDLAVTIAEDERSRRQGAAAGGDGEAAPAAAPSAALGLKVAELTEAQRKDLKGKPGVRVDAVTGAAARAGLREGDLILSVDNVEVASVKAFQAQIAKADKAKVINLVVRRDDVVSFVLLKPSR